jgi:hypothetical protein
MDGRALLVPQHKPCIASGASATPAASSFWRRLIIGASEASSKILVSPFGAAMLARRSACVWSNPWPA